MIEGLAFSGRSQKRKKMKTMTTVVKVYFEHLYWLEIVPRDVFLAFSQSNFGDFLSFFYGEICKKFF